MPEGSNANYYQTYREQIKNTDKEQTPRDVSTEEASAESIELDRREILHLVDIVRSEVTTALLTLQEALRTGNKNGELDFLEHGVMNNLPQSVEHLNQLLSMLKK